MGEPAAGSASTTPARSRARRWAVRLLIAVAIIAVIALVFAGMPWDEVIEALRGVTAWQALVLLGLVLLRAVVLGLPLTALMPEVSPIRSARSDLAGNLIANFAPPPADIGVRYAMFRSWKVDAVEGLAALTLSALLFYAARFIAPLVGFLLILLARRFDDEYLTMALIAGVVSGAIIAALIILARADRGAAWLGRTAGRIAARVRPVDPADWEQAMVSFRQRVNVRLRRGWPWAVVAVAAMFVVESIIMIVCLRFVGVPGDAVPAVEIAGAFLVTYPLNMLPLGGLVILDGVVLQILTSQGGAAYEAAIAAGLVLWRVATLVTPFLLGLIVLLHWQRREGRGVQWRNRPATDDLEPTP